MKYYFDTEFHEREDGRIELISIGIVNEIGEKLYLVSSEFNVLAAYNRKQDDDQHWLRDNVLFPIIADFNPLVVNEKLSYFQMLPFFGDYGKTVEEIREEIINFVGENNPIFVAYYASYDWVVFCQTFGGMLNLPENWPMYCYDLKQKIDDIVSLKIKDSGIKHEDKLAEIKSLPSYPKNKGEHLAINDAEWNMELDKFIEIIIHE